MSKEDVEKLIGEFRATFEREDGLIDKYVYRDNPDEETGIETLSMPDAIAEWLSTKLTPFTPLVAQNNLDRLEQPTPQTPTPTVKEESHTQ